MSIKILGIDIGSFQVRAVMAEYSDDGMKIIGIGTEKANGVKKGAITNIELASKSVKNALTNAQRVAGTRYDKVIVSISGANTKSLDSNGVVNIPNHEIGISEIERAMQIANHYASVSTDYEKLHVLPYNFKVDEQEHIEDPLGMNGTRLEVHAHIIIVQKSILNNLKKAINLAGIEIDNIVLSGYASSIATLNDDEKELGAALIDIGGSVSDVVVHSGNSIIFNDFLPVGSSHITNDLSIALHTPLPKAEEIKIGYGSLIAKSTDLIELPELGDENKSNEVSLDIISKVIYARAEETLVFLSNIIQNSKNELKHKDMLGAGVVFTGGMTKLDGFKELASMVFDKYQIRIAKPKNMEGLYEVIRDPSNSCVIGLCMYGAGHFTPYEIDSEKKMRYKNESIVSSKARLKNLFEEDSLLNNEENKEQEEFGFKYTKGTEQFQDNGEKDIKDELLDISDIKHEKNPSVFSKIWHWMTQWF
ncbi:cell division protein FtsA [Campylobacter pinnipediorum subsp. pinnipediorum]|nr:cell division protein FtsA [Campylobacter pinnipediorum subsp. pinnipediorum]